MAQIAGRESNLIEQRRPLPPADLDPMICGWLARVGKRWGVGPKAEAAWARGSLHGNLADRSEVAVFDALTGEEVGRIATAEGAPLRLGGKGRRELLAEGIARGDGEHGSARGGALRSLAGGRRPRGAGSGGARRRSSRRRSRGCGRKRRGGSGDENAMRGPRLAGRQGDSDARPHPFLYFGPADPTCGDPHDEIVDCIVVGLEHCAARHDKGLHGGRSHALVSIDERMACVR